MLGFLLNAARVLDGTVDDIEEAGAPKIVEVDDGPPPPPPPPIQPPKKIANNRRKRTYSPTLLSIDHELSLATLSEPHSPIKSQPIKKRRKKTTSEAGSAESADGAASNVDTADAWKVDDASRLTIANLDKKTIRGRSSVNRKQGTALQRAVSATAWCVINGNKEILLADAPPSTSNGNANDRNIGIIHICHTFSTKARTIRRNIDIATGLIQHADPGKVGTSFLDEQRPPYTAAAYFPVLKGPYSGNWVPSEFRQDCVRNIKCTLLRLYNATVLRCEAMEQSTSEYGFVSFPELMLKLIKKEASDWAKDFAELPMVLPAHAKEAYEQHSRADPVARSLHQSFSMFCVRKRKALMNAFVKRKARADGFGEADVRLKVRASKPTREEVENWKRDAIAWSRKWLFQCGIAVEGPVAAPRPECIPREEPQCENIEAQMNRIRAETEAQRPIWRKQVGRQLATLQQMLGPIVDPRIFTVKYTRRKKKLPPLPES